MNALTVTQFVGALNEILDHEVFPDGVLIEGEVAEYKVSQGKWIWFRLKDGESSVECFATVWQVRTPMEDGMSVRISGHPRLFGRSGKFSVNVDRVEPVGEGALKRAFEMTRAKLLAEGVFAEERKRPLPRFPERIGLIASRESAAYTDFLRILNGRFCGLTVNSLHVQVQGKDAVADIVQAFRYFNEHPELADVIVLTRGGGSLEDLLAFNSEEVARAVFGSRLPVICAVGHERDESLADYAADVRAATPTHAAEMVVPDRGELLARVSSYADRLEHRIAETAVRQERNLNRMVSGLEMRLDSVVGEVRQVIDRLDDCWRDYGTSVERKRERLDFTVAQIDRAIRRVIVDASRSIDAATRLLRSSDPKRPLALGYALVRKEGRIVRSASALRIDESIAIEFGMGSAEATVTKVNNE